MTNKEYLIKSLNGMNLSDDDIDIILVKAGLDGDADLDIKACDTAVYKRFSVILKGTMQNVSEGGYSVSWNIDAIKLFVMDDQVFDNRYNQNYFDRLNSNKMILND